MIELEKFSILGDIDITLCNNRNRVNGHEELLSDGVDDGDERRPLLDLVVQLVSSVKDHRQPCDKPTFLYLKNLYRKHIFAEVLINEFID